METAKRDLHDQMEELKKTLRTESNNLSDARDLNRQIQLELEDAKRTIDKFSDMKKELEARFVFCKFSES